mgnify:CR=1 FL=1
MTSNLYTTRKNALIKYYRENHQLPTYDELAELFNVKSKGSIHKYIQKFIDEGILNKSVSGKLIPTTKLYGLRVLGTVQAGFPTTAEQELSDTMSLDQFLIQNPEASYLLEVSGDSMVGAGIVEGDMVIVDRSRQPKNGDIIVASVDNDWTMKYYIKEGSKIILRPANKRFTDIIPDQELQIAGVVTSVIRKY